MTSGNMAASREWEQIRNGKSEHEPGSNNEVSSAWCRAEFGSLNFKMTAEFDAGVGLLIVFLVVLALVLFIAKWQPNFSPYKSSTIDDVPEVAMMGIQLPFTIQIKEPESATISDGVLLKLKTEESCIVNAYWGVQCSTLQDALQQTPLLLIHQTDVLLQEKSLLQNDHICFDGGSEEEDLLLQLPDEDDTLELGPPPRTRYPLCVIIKSRQAPGLQTQEPLVVGSVTIIHIPDEILTEKCYIISHILVTNKGQAHNLQTLYMAAEPNATSVHSTQASEASSQSNRSTDSQSTAAQIARDCTVCQNAPISRVILPCRHACVCTSCFPLVTRCPMCRGFIESFFSMSNDAIYQQGLMNRTNGADKDWMGRFEDWCERLNQRLGFHQ